MDLDNNIEGWLSVYEGHLLTALASKCNTGCIVNIGCHCGRSIEYILQGKPEHVPLYGIDIVKQKKLDTTSFNFIHGSSQDQTIVDQINNIELLFIDGDHSYEAVSNDIKLWIPKVIKGGVIIFHDAYPVGNGIAYEPGVKKAVQEYFETCNSEEMVYDKWFASAIHRCDTMCIIQRAA